MFFFNRFSNSSTQLAFIGGVLMVLISVGFSILFTYSENLQIVINIGVTITLFCMLFLIRNLQKKNYKTIKIKLINVNEKYSNGIVLKICVALLLPIIGFAQQKRCKTTLEEYQYMAWAINSQDTALQSEFIKKSPITNHLNNNYFFAYTPIYRYIDNCHIGYSVTMENKEAGSSRTIAIPYENPSEFENLFNELMGWPADEREAFLKSYLIFENTERGKW